MWIDLGRCAKDVKIFVSHVMLIKRWLQLRSSEIKIGCPILCTVGFFSLAIPVIAQCPHEQSGHGDIDGDYGWAQQYGLTKIDLATATSECQISQHWDQDKHHSLGWSFSNLVRCWLHWTTSSMERTTLCLYRSRYLFWLHFLHIMLLPKPQFMNLQNALSIIIVFHKVLLLTKVLTSQPEKCGSGPTIMECTGLTMFPTILKQLAW